MLSLDPKERPEFRAFLEIWPPGTDSNPLVKHSSLTPAFPDFGLDNWFNLLKSPAISASFFARDQRFICASRILASQNVRILPNKSKQTGESNWVVRQALP